jgi:hypothetical protein
MHLMPFVTCHFKDHFVTSYSEPIVVHLLKVTDKKFRKKMAFLIPFDILAVVTFIDTFSILNVSFFNYG